MNKIITTKMLRDYYDFRSLHLNSLNLKQIPDELLKYDQLKLINLSNNSLTDITPLLVLKELEFIFLSYNQIKDIKQFLRFKKLKILFLDNNLIEDISSLVDFQRLEKVDLRHNKITELPDSIFSFRLRPRLESTDLSYDGIYLHANPLIYPPIEIITQGQKAIDAYIISLNKEAKNLNEIKILLVGDGAAGKTSLLKRLIRNEFNFKEPQTHGIRIERIEEKMKEENIKINFWDFGGQEIMHATHQFFLSARSIYILVLDSRKDESAEYWLKHIESFGGNAPVLIILNKIDENPAFEIDRSFLSEKYSNIIGYHKLSCYSGEGLLDFKEQLYNCIYNSDMRRTPFSNPWFAVKEEIVNLKEDYIKYSKFIKICELKKVNVKIQQTTLLGFLHDLGILLHFEALKLYDTQVMNPAWLTNGVYRIINSEHVVHNNGVLNTADIEEIVNDNTKYPNEQFYYPPNKCLFLLKIMQKFELCYQLSEDTYIIPELLPIQRFERGNYQDEEILTFSIQYETFFPTSIFPRLMVQMHHLIKGNAKWRTGMILFEESLYNSEAYIFVDRGANKITIEVTGEKKTDLLLFIRKTIQDINLSFEKLDYKELIYLSSANGKFISVDFNELLGFEIANRKNYYSGLLQREFLVRDLISKYEPINYRIDKNLPPVNVFISYSHNDEKYKDDLKKALSPLWRLNKITLFDDKAITIGTPWEESIFSNIANSKIIILLISPDFISSDFCYSKELKIALKSYKNKEKSIFPIRLRSVNYDGLPIAELQAFPEKWIVSDYSFEQRDRIWTQVAKQLEIEVDHIRSEKISI